MTSLLIANRGEIAVRIARTAADLGISSVAVHTADDAAALHTRLADRAVALPGTGVAGYLDGKQLVAAAVEAGCGFVHPGYGFLSEDAGFARLCAEAGLVFVGPSADTLELFGDKARTRALATEVGLPVLAGTGGPTGLSEALSFLAGLGPGAAVMVKAVHGGGGRGTRPAFTADELPAVYERCASEAAAAFGNGDLYVERLLPGARHVEVQVVGDGTAVRHLWDRECSLQRARQKVVEVAPAATVPFEIRERLLAGAERLAAAVGYRGLATVEFLVGADGTVAFLETNPRLQVEHPVTEAVTGLDLVALQLRLASGATLADLGLGAPVPPPRGTAVEARVNLETVGADGGPRPAAGTLTTYEPPTGPGVRVDGFGYAGYATSLRYDPLLAKVIVHAPAGDLAAAVGKSERALREFRVEGVATNLPFLRRLLALAAVRAGEVTTTFLEEHAAELSEAPAKPPVLPAAERAGATVDATDPLAVLDYGRSAAGPPAAGAGAGAAAGAAAGAPAGAAAAAAEVVAPDGATEVRATVPGTVVEVARAVGDAVGAGAPLLVLEAMKLEHVVAAPVAGTVTAVLAEVGQPVPEGAVLALLAASSDAEAATDAADDVDLDRIRPDVAELLERRRLTRDEARPDAVARRRRTGQRTARENIDDLVDPGSLVEYGELTIAGRRARNTIGELIHQTPADGFVMGLAQVDGGRVAVASYDYTVLAGTQGARNHEKLDRIAELALRWKLPIVLFAEGGGGRPGDTEHSDIIRGFEYWGRLSGSVPMVGITSGRCFAGNAALLGCCDVVIATKDSALGMGGPAMVEGGGLGVFRPEEIGPVDVMTANGVIDVLVDDETAAVSAAQRYLSYIQGPRPEWECADQRLLRHAIPENRLRGYDVRRVVELIADTGSVLELRPRFGRAMITALVRVEGRPMGLIANNPLHLGGAIDADAADKAARMLQLCESYRLPVLSLQDTPGNMVGPEAEKAGLVRHCSRLFVIGANLTVPILSVVLRKSYGLGAIAMTGGSPQAAMGMVAWPTGEFGGMGLEGAVKLGYRNELAAIDDPAERRAEYERRLARMYQEGKALSRAMGTFLDGVIDPAETRPWLAGLLASLPPEPPRTAPALPWIDAW